VCHSASVVLPHQSFRIFGCDPQCSWKGCYWEKCTKCNITSLEHIVVASCLYWSSLLNYKVSSNVNDGWAVGVMGRCSCNIETCELLCSCWYCTDYHHCISFLLSLMTVVWFSVIMPVTCSVCHLWLKYHWNHIFVKIWHATQRTVNDHNPVCRVFKGIGCLH